MLLPEPGIPIKMMLDLFILKSNHESTKEWTSEIKDFLFFILALLGGIYIRILRNLQTCLGLDTQCQFPYASQKYNRFYHTLLPTSRCYQNVSIVQWINAKILDLKWKIMDKSIIPNNYCTPSRRVSWVSRQFPNLSFYSRLPGVVLTAAKLARKGIYYDEDWVRSSRSMIDLLEMVGVSVEMENLSAISKLDSPCVFVGNHMSVLETFVLPCIIQPHTKFTFVVKKSLIDYPVFKHVMRSRDPIVVGRINPREDLKTVMADGLKRLNDGISVLIFPQTTRTTEFDPKAFNTIGIKLAKRAGVPVIPFALKTDAWGIGRWIKDFGKVDPSKQVSFWFGNPITISGKGKDEHEGIIQFILDKLNAARD